MTRRWIAASGACACLIAGCGFLANAWIPAHGISRGVEPCLIEGPSDAEKLILAKNTLFLSSVERFSKMDRTAMVPSNTTDKNSSKVRVPLGPLAACFAEGTPSEVVQAFTEALQMAPDGAWPRPGNGRDYWLGSRWSGGQGTPRALTWSLVPDGLSIASGVGEPAAGSSLFARMDALFGAANRAVWIAKFQECFDRWTYFSGVTYTRVRYGANDWDDGASWGATGSTGARGDVRVAMKNIDGNNGILAYNYYPSNGDMVLDASENWASSTNGYRFMKNIVTHEHGHGLGIAHVCSNNSSQLMEPYLSTAFDGPQHDDTRAVQRHYGDPSEIDDTVGQAFDAGTTDFPFSGTFGTATGASNVTRRSIDADGDVDWIKFTITKDGSVSLTLRPIGYTYDDNAQSGNGSCPSGSTTNSLAVADLQIDLRNSSGATLIQNANATGAGLAEAITNVELPAGKYTIKVFEANTPTRSQLYLLDMSVTAPGTKTIKGKVGLQDYTGAVTSQPVTFSIRKPGNASPIETKTVNLAADGSYTFAFASPIAAGSYDLAAKAPHWLREVIGPVVLSGSGASAVNFSLVNGDVDGDNAVTVFDYTALSNAFDSVPGDASWDADADLDGDGAVTVFDYNILSQNFDLAGEQ